jgi:tetratricopeptide (TPR) repeat protein
LQQLQFGKYLRNGFQFWDELMRDLPRGEADRKFRIEVLRIAVEKASSDEEMLVEIVSTFEETLDIDEPADRAVLDELVKPLRGRPNQPRLDEMLQARDLRIALRTGAAADVVSRLAGIKNSFMLRRLRTQALAALLIRGEQGPLRELLQSLPAETLFSRGTIDLSWRAYRQLGMADEAALAEEKMPDLVYHSMLEAWSEGEVFPAQYAYGLAEIVGKPELIPHEFATDFAVSRQHSRARLTLESTDALLRGEWEVCVRKTEEALQKYPSYYHFQWLRGRAYAHLGKKAEALAALRIYTALVHDEPSVVDAKKLIQDLEAAPGK